MRHKLLIAESDSEAREIFRRLFTDHRYDVATAANGVECVENLRRLTPAALVLDRDLHWGGADGVLAWLREQDGMAGIAVVLTATADCRPDPEQDNQPSMVRTLRNPFALTTLLEAVRTAIASEAQEESSEISPEIFIG